MRKLNVDKDIAIFSVLAFILIIELFLLLPLTIKNFGKLNRKVFEIKQRIINIKKDWPRREEYLDINDKLKTEVDKLHSKVIYSNQEANLFSFISSGSRNFGIEIIEALTPSEPIDFNPSAECDAASGGNPRIGNRIARSIITNSANFKEFKYFPIAVKLKGRFHNLAKFLNYLQGSEYFFEVKEIKVIAGQPYHSVEMLLYGLTQETKQ